jgi:phosphatidylserine/phosphatidylglycerophosphate/cardiolipin synthase-like enzyme
VSIILKVYDNGDHTCLVWLPAGRIENCLGFTIERLRGGKVEYVHGAVGFSEKEPFPKDNPWKWPIQRFLWWDYHVKPGDVVQYRVIPVCGSGPGDLKLREDLASGRTPPMTVTVQCTPHMSAYFNKGILASQWVSRELDQLAAQGASRTATATAAVQEPGNVLRDALGGLLKMELLKHLADAKAKGGQVYLVLYELGDQELEAALIGLGASAHLILANGAFKPPTNDENHDVRKRLNALQTIEIHDRLVTGNHFAHNKIAIFCDSAGNPQKVLTGSTNWTYRGLCAQANNALVIDDKAVAKMFLDQWKLIKSAGNVFPKTLVASNSKPKQLTVDDVKVTTWFVPTDKAEDMDYARNLINQAKQGILFLFFNPGAFQQDAEKETLLQTVLDRHKQGSEHYDPNLYIRGVVNQDIEGLTKPVTLFEGGKTAPQELGHDVLVPAAIKTRFHSWEDELLKIGVMVHSKVIVIDPFGEHPVLMTGSHNLGLKASQKNDDNLVIVEGAGSLAAAYAVNIIAIFQTYRWNHYVALHAQTPNDPKTWHGPEDVDTWQDGYLKGDSLAELRFWLAQPAAAAATAGHSQAAQHTAKPPNKHPAKHVSA